MGTVLADHCLASTSSVVAVIFIMGRLLQEVVCEASLSSLASARAGVIAEKWTCVACVFEDCQMLYGSYKQGVGLLFPGGPFVRAAAGAALFSLEAAAHEG